ncbi:MAG: fumarylacetoacetate hydrolase family protein [Ilumatobacter sp.]|nr:fumarylacetoacetate hydrolase family protein [Ilumatobacter sp.]
MRIANIAGRACIVVDDDHAVDVAVASDGRYGPDPMTVLEQWGDVVAWATDLPEGEATPFDPADLECPVPAPRQVFAIGLNYRGHAEESGMTLPEFPATFTKFPASLTGPYAEVLIDRPAVDYEVELVVVIGRAARDVAVDDAWSYVAGVTVGQDISDRHLQFAAGAQFSLGKSRPGYGPMGPWIVTVDELDDPNDLALGCSIDGEVLQSDRTSDLIFDVPTLVSELSGVLPLLPGDVIFTGTPSGIGAVRQPPRFLAPGDVVESWIEGVGRIRNVCV